VAAGFKLGSVLAMTEVDFRTSAPVGGNWDVRWIHGAPRTRACSDPPIQIHRNDPHSYVLRQSKALSFEAPFLYLLFGNERALLLDTGATKDPARFPLRHTVDGLISEWLADNPRSDYPLVVAHSHGHNDHVAADSQFADRPNTVVVPRTAPDVLTHFGLVDRPFEPTPFDLGGRVLEIFAIPGHHAASVAIYDPWTGWLLTGDTVYPGRLYVFEFAAFVDSLDRLVEFAHRRPVTHVLGCHIEMTTTPRRDYPLGAKYQPNEPPLQMTVAQLEAVRDAAHQVAAAPGAHRFDEFVIFNGRCTGELVRQLVRTMGRRARALVTPHSLR
jgi:glyoxylase-like metal-dependent hydrolase (beta-lactamase superfamily II)